MTKMMTMMMTMKQYCPLDIGVKQLQDVVLYISRVGNSTCKGVPSFFKASLILACLLACYSIAHVQITFSFFLKTSLGAHPLKYKTN